jgi:hypothetical protein
MIRVFGRVSVERLSHVAAVAAAGMEQEMRRRALASRCAMEEDSIAWAA